MRLPFLESKKNDGSILNFLAVVIICLIVLSCLKGLIGFIIGVAVGVIFGITIGFVIGIVISGSKK